MIRGLAGFSHEKIAIKTTIKISFCVKLRRMILGRTVRFQVDNRTAHVSPHTIDSRLVCVLVVPRGAVACGPATHGLPSQRHRP